MTLSTIVSVDQTGQFVYGPSSSTSMAESMSGRYVAFTGYDPVFAAQVFVKDTETGAVDQVGVGYDASISADGRYVAFTTGHSEISVADRTGVQPSIVFTAVAGAGDFCGHPSISGDGKRVAFVSNASGSDQVWVKDLGTGTLIQASIDDAGNLPIGTSNEPVISADGNKVAFRSSYFASIPAYGGSNIYLKDIAPLFAGTMPTSGTLQVVNLDSFGAWSNQDANAPSISADGTYVAFQSFRGSNWAVGDVPFYTTEIFVKNTSTGNLSVASADANGSAVQDAGSYLPSISYDGRYVAFMSYHNWSQLGNTFYNIFRKDMIEGSLDIVSTGTEGQIADGSSYTPSISGNGNWVSFKTDASNLFTNGAGNNVDTNGVPDVYAMRARPFQTAAIVIGAGGGDCSQIGTWDDATSTCTMTQDLSVSGRGIMIESDNVTLNGNGFAIRTASYPGDVEEGVYVAAAKNVTVSGVTVEGFKYGVYLGWTDNSHVSGVTASGNQTGIKLKGTTNTFVDGSLITASAVGIDVDPSDYNSFAGNTLNGNDIGLLCDGSFNNFGQNNFISNWTQAEVTHGSGNSFTGNYWSDATAGIPYSFGGGEDLQPLLAPTCDSTRPDLGITKANVYWQSYADYLAGLLSIDYWVANHSGQAYDVKVVDSISTNGVKLAGGAPASLGDFVIGWAMPLTLKYNVPEGVSSFRTTIYATARDGCWNLLQYPGPLPG